ncbi:MAG: phosphatidylserine synthase, partial [Flavobacteriaceae bacterium]|nr:phosphatidylserine synthase [Flavobacteriaceae bacterium]
MRSLRRDWMDGLSCEVGNWITFEEKTGIFSSWEINKVQYLPFIGLLLSLAAAYRLARFNIDKRQTNYFIGLPTPAMSLFVLSLPLILLYNPGGAIEALILNRYFLIAVTIILSLLMNVELKMFSLKLKSSTLRDNWAQLTFVLVAILLIFLFKIVALPLIILFYILFSFFLQLGSKEV